MKKNLFKTFLVGLLAISLTGCNSSDEPVPNNDLPNNSKEEEKVTYKDYQLWDNVTLVDKSKWLVLENEEEFVLLLSRKIIGSADSYLELAEDIIDYEWNLKEDLVNNGGDSSSLDVRIPTISDFKKYFGFVIDESEMFIEGPVITDEQHLSIEGLRNIWVENETTGEWSDNNIFAYPVYTSFSGGVARDRKSWMMTAQPVRDNANEGIAPIIYVKKSNILY